ncbi:MAG: radical SAM protein [Candidatus Omnitrophica bacterium]|jgi:MoaA/NifB/PqqE/SkfB family radical SAM enzyme|nr:radical SAM protein [Candidatus Omnitrophota bacterium]
MRKTVNKIYRGAKAVNSLLKYKITRKPFPLCAHLQITKRCNLRCIYCYADPANLTNTPDLEYKEFIKLVDELTSMGTRWIRFLGGEPLIREDIGQMIDYAKSKGAVTEMNTNGFFMKERANKIKNLDSLVVSIDGTRETNDRCRGIGSYAKAIEAIEIAKDLGMSVRLHGCLSKYHTLQDIEHLAGLAVKYGTAFNFSAPSPIYFRDDLRMDGHPSQEQVAMLHKRCVQLKSLGYPLTNSSISEQYVKKWPNPHSDVLRKEDFAKLNITRGSYVPCAAGKLYCTIDVDGRVYACASLWKHGLNYRQVGFKKAWEYLNNLDCYSCNYIANIELNMLLSLNPKMLFEVGSYVLGQTACRASRKFKKEKISCR